MRPPLSKELWFTDDLSGAARSLNFKQWDGQERRYAVLVILAECLLKQSKLC